MSWKSKTIKIILNLNITTIKTEQNSVKLYFTVHLDGRILSFLLFRYLWTLLPLIVENVTFEFKLIQILKIIKFKIWCEPYLNFPQK